MKVKILALSLSLLSLQSFAADIFKLSGYGTLGLAHSTSSEADYRSNYFQPDGSARSRNWDPNLDSKAGVQADVFLIPRMLTATVQVQVARRYDRNYTPALEWANLKFQPGENAYLRGGRIVAPMFMQSETRNVGYTMTSIRPPVDVYYINPISRLDGADVGYRFQIGEVTINTQLAAGVYKDKIASASTISNQTETDIKAGVFNSTAEYESLTLRAGFGRLKVTNDSLTVAAYKAGLASLAATYPAEVASLRASTGFDAQYMNVYGLGFNYDPGQWFVLGEIAGRRGHTDMIQSAYGWYLQGGYRYGKWTPFAGYSQVKSRQNFDQTVMPSGTAAAAVINAVNADFRLKLEQSTTSVGLRYDVWKNMALKTQLDYIHKPAGASGTFFRYTPGFANGARDVAISSVALDFIF